MLDQNWAREMFVASVGVVVIVALFALVLGLLVGWLLL